MSRLDNKRTLITGGASGIGLRLPGAFLRKAPAWPSLVAMRRHWRPRAGSSATLSQFTPMRETFAGQLKLADAIQTAFGRLDAD